MSTEAARGGPAAPLVRQDALVMAGLALVTLATRLFRLGSPRVLVFDEVYYALDAADLLERGAEVAPAHPPLGKWLIASGVWVTGFDPIGWRIASVVAGTALVLLTYASARLLTADRRLATIAALLVAVDGIAFVTSRLALLDVFVAVFLLGIVWCLIAARTHLGDHRRIRRYRTVAAVLLGLGMAVKWSAFWILPVMLVVFLHADLRLQPPGRPRRRAVAATLGVLALVPSVLYLASYGPWFVNADRTRVGLRACDEHDEQPCELGVLERVDVWVDHQLDLVDFHRNLEVRNRYAAPAWTWVIQREPAALLSKPCLPEMRGVPERLDDGVCGGSDTTTKARILAVANPVVWFPSVAAAALLAWWSIGPPLVAAFRRGAARPRWRADRRAMLLAGLAASQWVPWIVAGRQGYTYYAVTLIPILVLCLAEVLERWPAVRQWAGPAILVGSMVMFVWLYPLLTGAALDDGAAGMRLLMPSWP